ncbi:ribonuclease P protein component [Lacrimispora sp. NSJ-141]|uniref:Ribonuclease P protein component n=1 Tax=Lientehia hominis TaxID=2897778 RepID=A0AAP2RJQ2_9FIRM|nr:ribonuclease P protein component [Lientehia hominis]MCD2493267.1 ribonuclease P protein component [Lientehia hominis]
MGKFHSLKRNQDFQAVYRNGRSFANSCLVMYAKKRNDEEENRVGISVSKKVGNSVVRHRLKRLIREAYRINCGQAVRGYDLVVIAREKSKEKTYKEITGALLSLLRSHRLL